MNTRGKKHRLQLESLETRTLLDGSGFIALAMPIQLLPIGDGVPVIAPAPVAAAPGNNAPAPESEPAAMEEPPGQPASSAAMFAYDDGGPNGNDPRPGDPNGAPSEPDKPPMNGNSEPINDVIEEPINDPGDFDPGVISPEEPGVPQPLKGDLEFNLDGLWDFQPARFTLQAIDEEPVGTTVPQRHDDVAIPAENKSDAQAVAAVADEDDWLSRLRIQMPGQEEESEEAAAAAYPTTDGQPGSPQSSGWLSEALPLDVNALDQGMRRLLDEIEALGLRLADLPLGRLSPWLVAALVTAAACEISRRQVRSSQPRLTFSGMAAFDPVAQ